MASSVGVVGFLVLVAALLQCTTAQNHNVGDATGWTVPPSSNFYTTWAANQVFRVGDNLTFTFTTGAHDVLQVPRERHDSCTGNGAIGSIITRGPATVPLTSAGQHYFICTVGAHCSLGQRLSINVLSATTPTPTPTTPTPTPTPTTPSAGTPPTVPSADSPAPPPFGGGPPTPSSATSLAAGLGVAAVLSAISFLF